MSIEEINKSNCKVKFDNSLYSINCILSIAVCHDLTFMYEENNDVIERFYNYSWLSIFAYHFGNLITPHEQG